MNPRFAAWLRSGGDRSKLWLYMEFISAAKRFAHERQMGVTEAKGAQRFLQVTDQAMFTSACDQYADRILA